MQKTPFTYIVYLSALCFSIVFAEQKGDRIDLVHADTLRSKGEFREVIGRVKFRQALRLIYSDYALYSPTTGMVELRGNVVMDEPDRKVKANFVNYHELSGDFLAKGKVDMTIGDSVRVQCGRAVYTELDSTVQLYDDVVINNLSDNGTIIGTHGYWKRDTDVGLVEGQPVYKLPDTSGEPPDTLVIKSKQVFFDRPDRSALFVGDVKLDKGTLRATADSLLHKPDSNYTYLSGSPIIWREQDKLSGNTVIMNYRGRELEKIVVEGDAEALSPSKEGDERMNRLAGHLMTITLVNDTTRIVRVDQEAYGRYHVWDEEQHYQGANLAVADVIELTIINNKTSQVLLEGGSNGSFYPPGMVPNLDNSGMRRNKEVVRR